MEEKLKPCPFCGAAAEIREASWTGIEYVRCSNEKCFLRPSTYRDHRKFEKMSTEKAKKLSIKEWNSRVSEEELRIINRSF